MYKICVLASSVKQLIAHTVHWNTYDFLLLVHGSCVSAVSYSKELLLFINWKLSCCEQHLTVLCFKHDILSQKYCANFYFL